MRRSGRQSLVHPGRLRRCIDSVRNRRVNRRSAEVAARKIKVLGKPYTRVQLGCALREALDG